MVRTIISRRLLWLSLFLCWALSTFAVKVGVLLPLKDQRATGQMMLEFYRGMLMAVDSLKQEGLSVEVYTYDSGYTEADLNAVLEKEALADVQVIFGPGSSLQTSRLASYCKQHSISLVMPFLTPCAQIGENPYVLQMTQPAASLYPYVMQLVMENFSDSHFVFLKTNEQDTEGESFQAYVQTQVTAFGLPSSVLNVQADDQGTLDHMDNTRNNVIILDSQSDKAMKATLAFLNRFRLIYPNYRISLVGYPEWLNKATDYAKDWYALDTHIYTTGYANPLSGRVIRFRQKYERSFHASFSNRHPSVAMRGFDLTYQVLRGENPNPLQQGFRFYRVSAQGGYVNVGMQLVRFGSDKVIHIIR